MHDVLKHTPVLLFDGYCNFCSSTIQFIFKHEKNKTMYFASLQSPAGIEILKHYNIDPTKIDSLVLIENEKAYIKSTAALKLSTHLKALYPLLYGFIIVPAFIRNVLYDYVARNRYRWFGKSESCMLPDKEFAKRFL